MKKTFMILLSLLLTASLMSAAGCRSRLKEGIERDRKRYIVNEFSLEDAYSEEEGFHYPGVPWGTGIASLQELLGVTISDVAGYGENGVLFYNADQLRTKVLGRTSDGASIGCVKDTLYMISHVFDSGSDETASISQKDLRDQYLEKVKEAFGEPDRHEETERVISEVTNYYDVWYWDAETADGKKTEFQLASSSILKGGDPSYISIGVVWLLDDVLPTENAEETEEE